ncbi:MAG: protocatechuate 3,4-dioxygenase subunit alpha [Ilumatobacteraceae bacterium]
MPERPGLTPSQTVGPFLHLALADPALRYPVAADDPGAVTVGGVVVDGAGGPVPDAVIETWQAGGPFARCPTGPDGGWDVRTVKPPGVPTRDGTAQAPHLVVSIFARGLLDRLVTRLYFGDEDAANAADPTLAVIEPDRRHLLVAALAGPRHYRLDIRLQGADESVFFSL